MTDEDLQTTNSDILRDTFSAELLRRITTSKTKPPKRTSGRSRKRLSSDAVPAKPQQETPEQNDAEDLAEFIEYLSQELFDSLPPELQALSYSAIQSNPRLESRITAPTYVESLLPTLPPSITDSLTTYSLLSTSTSPQNLLLSTLSSYITTASAPPPPWSSTRATACEICERDWIPLTYHHLIPKSTHDRVIKRGWHPEHMLNSVAWLCRACHSFVHKIAGNEELAKEWFTVERLMGREDVGRWAKWVGGVRWKAR